MISQRIDAAVTIPPEYLSATPPPPYTVKIELCRSCNFHCTFCGHSGISKTSGHMDWQLYQRIVQELAGLGVKELAPFFFGESFLDQRLPEAIRHAHDCGIPYVFLTTNGSAAGPDRVEQCMAAGLNSLKFSLNYADKEQLHSIAQVPAEWFEKIINNIIAARKIRDEHGYQCGLYASYIMYDAEQGERMLPVLDRLKPYLDEVYALPLYNQAAFVSKEGWQFTGGNTGRFANPVPIMPCWVLFREGHVNFDGTVTACSFSVNDEFICGDLNTQPFMEIWHSPKFQEFRKSHLQKNLTGSPCDACIKRV